jgi:N-acetylmuramoyl-L-alanine amidase
MRRTMRNIVLFLFVLTGKNGSIFAMPHKDYGGCDGKCEERIEGASLHCLAETIYYEAGNQPTRGKLAVAYVVLNRTAKTHSTICSIVQQPGQFAWVRNRALRRRPKNLLQWTECQELAEELLEEPDQFEDPTNGAIAFRRSRDVHFSKRWTVSTTIGGHIFYRAK